MAKPLLPDDLWNRIEPLLPPPKPRRFRFPGRKPIDNRKALTGILFVLKTGICWEDLPQEMGCGSGMTCWRRLRDWHEAGVWQSLHELLLAELNAADRIDWSRAAVDSSSARALGGGEKTGPNPTDRAKPGSKHHVITDGGGIPLAMTLTGANAADVGQMELLLDAIPAVRGKVGHPRSRPDHLYADQAYDSEPHRESPSRPRDRSSNRASPRRTRKRAGSVSLGRGTNVLVVSSSEEAPPTNRVARRLARGTDVARL